MAFVSSRLYGYLPLAGALFLVALFALSSAPRAQAQEEEPIAYVGHGAFFDRGGHQIVPTAEWVGRAQNWYRSRLLAGLDGNQQGQFAAFERRLGEGLDADGQARLVVQQRALDWLVARLPRTVANGRMRAKLNALAARLRFRLPRRDDPDELRRVEEFRLDPRIEERLRQPELAAGGPVFLVTANGGQAYLDECAANDVPIPPAINDMGPTKWRNLGFIPQADQFIVGSPAQLRVYEDADGMCLSLPRFNSNQTMVDLDGVICLSRTTSKVCFWDNSMNNGGNFSFLPGQQIPIGVPDLAVDAAGRYQAGGAEIEFAGGGVCTDCHAGENPYIIHPASVLSPSLLFGDLADPPLNLPTFGPDRYDPIVGASWPQNQLSHAQPLVPAGCVGCHQQGGSGGRFPHLSDELPGYCGVVLARALTRTMPFGAPGSLDGTPDILAFQAYCGTPPSAGPANRGDPHLTTTNDVHYDFQAAGEFVSLRNSATGFELQTRQTPVLTAFTPDPNPHTGLASCVSVNTAAALRVGGRRVSYQPPFRPRAADEPMQLRIDGRLTALPPGGRDLGGGNRIARAATGGGIDVRAADGTRVLISPNYWASQGFWFLNVEVLGTPAREGTMGHILPGDWLPRAPTGGSFGPIPASLAVRHLLLNRAFADAWRVRAATSLFDYGPGTSTATFTGRGWPPAPGASCAAIRGTPWAGGQPRQPVQPMGRDVAIRLCRVVDDKAAFDECVFDLTATGDPGMALAYRRTLDVRTTPLPIRSYR